MTRLRPDVILAGAASGAWAALTIAVGHPLLALLALLPVAHAAGIALAQKTRARRAEAPTVVMPRFLDELDDMTGRWRSGIG